MLLLLCLSIPAATPTWSPGDEELEQAALAVSLLAALPGALAPRTSSGAAAAAVSGAGGVAAGVLAGLRRDLWRLWLVLAGHDRRNGRAVSSIVVSLTEV
jgi:hypothetical protein